MGTLYILIPPHCDPSMPLMGASQLCGYARSVGFSADVVDLSLDLKSGGLDTLTDVDFESHCSYWRAIRNIKERFLGRYADTLFYARPTWDAATIASYRWNVFPDQSRFLADCKGASRPIEYYVRQIVSRPIADYYFISMMFASQFLDGLLLCYAIRQVAPDAKVVVGGGLITSLFTAKDDIRGVLAELVDIVSIGEGEFLLQHLSEFGCEQLLKNKISSQGSRRAVLVDAGMFKSGSPILVPMPAFDHLEKYMTLRPVVPYRISATCYWNKCAFCTDWLYKSRLYNVPIEEHVKRLCSLEKIASGVMLQDSALSPNMLRRFASALIKAGCKLRWGINARFDAHLTYDLLLLARESGCVFLRFGLESASKKVLASMNKGIDVGVARRIIGDTRKLGILTHVYCIAGYPGETDEDRNATRQFLMDERAYPDSFNVSQYVPYFAARSNFNGSICNIVDDGWHLHPPVLEDPKIQAYINGMKDDFNRVHPVFKTLISPAHTIGSYDMLMRW